MIETISLEDRVIAWTLVPGNTMLSSGHVSNNILNLRRLKEKPDLYDEVGSILCRKVLAFNPAAITYVPDGAKEFAVDVAEEIGKPIVHMEKKEDNPKEYRWAGDDDWDLLNNLRRTDPLVIIEDVATTWRSVARLLCVAGVAKCAAGAVVVVDRKWTNEPPLMSIRTDSVVAKRVPEDMKPDEFAYYESIAAELNKQ